MDYYRFAAYGISSVYPDGWRIELNPKSAPAQGDVVFHSETRDKVYISWGSLSQAKDRFDTLDAHVEKSLQKLKGMNGVKSFELKEKEERAYGEHTGILSKVDLQVVQGGFGGFGQRPVAQRVISYHFWCEHTSRFFVVYALYAVREENMAEEAFYRIAESISCHN